MSINKLPDVQHFSEILAGGKVIVCNRKFRPNYQRRRRSSAEILLTPREALIIRMVCTGRTAKQIALALKCGVRTVDTHRARIKRQIGDPANTPAGLVFWAVKNGVVRI
jgi:DNA-binding CsgD family transcriptional regulator